MGSLSWLRGGNDHQLAASTYAGRESATDRSSRLRRERHRNGGATRAARKGQKWEREDRAYEQYGRFGRRR